MINIQNTKKIKKYFEKTKKSYLLHHIYSLLDIRDNTTKDNTSHLKIGCLTGHNC